MNSGTNPVAAENEIVITRMFDAPRELVWLAMTDPDHVVDWWGPRGFTNPVCALDARPGGTWRIVMRCADATEYPCHGVYQEVVAPERLVFTNIATDNAGNVILDGHTSVTFADHGGKAELTLWTRMTAVVAYAAAMLEGMQAGWSQSLDRLSEKITPAVPGVRGTASGRTTETGDSGG